MDANARALAAEYGDGYRAGYKDGYQKGITDGQGQGYQEAKIRAHVVLGDMPDAIARLNTAIGKSAEKSEA